jgi:hypothetical protein
MNESAKNTNDAPGTPAKAVEPDDAGAAKKAGEPAADRSDAKPEKPDSDKNE